MPSLEGLPESPESKIVKAFYRVLSEDPRISSRFPTRRLIELPLSAFHEFAAFTMVVCPVTLRQQNWPARRQTTRPQILVGFYIPREQTNENSDLPGLDLLNLVRIIAWENAELKNTIADPDAVLTFATVEMVPEKLQPTPSGGVSVVWGIVTLETDIDPLTGEIF